LKKDVPNRYREEEIENGTEEQVLDPVENDNPELEKMTNSYLRVLADFENFKKRTNEEKIRDRKYANQELLEQLINVLDIFDKAVNMKTDDEKLNNFLSGFIMINTSFKQILESNNVKKVLSVGQQFDPRYHHAMETAWDESKVENEIIEEMQTGYTYKDRLLRPALVKVNKKEKGNENNE